MKRATRSMSSGEVSKSGKPCDRLIAPTSFDSRVMTAKMLTPPAGSFDGIARAWDIVLYDSRSRKLLYPVARLERHQRVLTPQCDDAVEVADLGNLTAHEAVTQTTKLVAIEISHDLVHELGWCRARRADAVFLELLKNVGAKPIGSHRRDREAERHSGRRRNVCASVSSGGSPPGCGPSSPTPRYFCHDSRRA